jgi:hypothetical protein
MCHGSIVAVVNGAVRGLSAEGVFVVIGGAGVDEGGGDAVEGGGGRLGGPDGKRTLRLAGILVRIIRGSRDVMLLLMEGEEVGIDVEIGRALPHPGMHLK